MMYFLHHLSDRFIGFNVFLYVTFRAIAAAVTAFLLTLIFGNFIIRILIALKLGQPIRGAAEVHRLAELHGGKQGTPTMGGVLVIGSVFVSSLMWARLDNRFVWLVLFCMVYLGALGFADDYLKVTKKKSEGISGRIKLVFQIALALIVTAVFLTSPLLEVQARSLYVPFVKAPVIANMGWFTFVFFLLVIVGSSNAVNLTDGLDGLAIGCTITVAFAYALLSYAAGNFRIAEYLQVPFYPFAGELTVVCSALIGAGLGFLWFNCFPHVTASSSLRVDRLEGKYGHRSVLDPLDHLCVARSCDTETEVKRALQESEYRRSWCGIKRERCGAAAQIGGCAGYSAR